MELETKMEIKVETKFQIRDFLKEVLVSNSLVDIIINLAYHPEMIDKSHKTACILYFKTNLIKEGFFIDDYKISKDIKISRVCYLHKTKDCRCINRCNEWNILDINFDYKKDEKRIDKQADQMIQIFMNKFGEFPGENIVF